MLIRYCLRCRSEFQMQTLKCLLCGGPTEVRNPAIPQDAEVVIVRTARYNWIIDLAEALAHKDIPVRVEEAPRRENFSLAVRIEDAKAAFAIDRKVFLTGLAEDLPALPEERLGACPACGADIPPGQVKCPECDLIIATSDEEIEQVLEEERSLAEDEESDE